MTFPLLAKASVTPIVHQRFGDPGTPSAPKERMIAPSAAVAQPGTISTISTMGATNAEE